VEFARRYPVSLAVVVAAVTATAAFFTVARPRYDPAVDVESVDLSRELHHSVAEVRAAFAAEGVAFSAKVDDPTSGMTMLGVGPRPWDVTDLSVTVLPAEGVVGIGHGEWEETMFEERVGNVLVQYGGDDEALLARVKRALQRLRPAVAPRAGPLAR
jgi:hypothetical protein